MTKTHLTIIAMTLSAIALQLAGIQHWAEATSPQFVSGVLLAIGSTVTALFTEKPGSPS